jgi:hypothetical protein
VRIWHNGTLLEQVFDSSEAMPRSTYETSFRLPWQPHDHLKIVLVVHLLWRGEQAVAWRELDNAASLLIFDGKLVLSHYDKNWDRSRFAEPAYIAFHIQGFQDGDGAVVKDYLVPGDKW